MSKGTAFTEEERISLNLRNTLPSQVETLEQQIIRSWKQLNSYTTTLHKNIYLMGLHDINRTLFFALVKEHLNEILPLVYTPTVGVAVQNFSDEFRQPLPGLYLTVEDQDQLDTILTKLSDQTIKIIVVTDGEGVLGIGDQGVGSIYIPVAKLMLYSLFAGVNPDHTLPIVLDMGTNNQTLLNNPLYLGRKYPRIAGPKYDAFIAKFVAATKNAFPNALLHWEDFGRDNAHKNLHLYRDAICSFNDDIQGTGAVALAAILAGVRANKSKLASQKIVIFGAGTAGTGIAEQIFRAMLYEGATEQDARKTFWLIDKNGLLTSLSTDITDTQRQFVRSFDEISHWKLQDKYHISLSDVVKNLRPTILIGCSGVGNAFTQEIITTMAQNVEHPIILPLSNPTEKSEAIPENLINWTAGKAFIASGSPFPPVNYKAQVYKVAQCNNALAFPGLGLGAIIVEAKKITNEMLWKAAETLYQTAPILQNIAEPLLPPISMAADIAIKIAKAVAKQAILDGVAQIQGNVDDLIAQDFWEPKY